MLRLNEILSKPGGNATFEIVFEYIFITEGDEKKVLRALKQTTPKIEKYAMSVAEQLEERGIKKGREEKETELIAAMLTNGVSVNDIAKFTGLSKTLIQKVEKELK